MSVEKFEELVLQGRNIFITGAGGTGKTYLMQEILKKYPANFVVTSSTGISASGLFEGARTIHSFSTIGISSNEEFPTAKCLDYFEYMRERDHNAISEVKKLIIEEVSMISASQFNLIDRVFRRVRRKNKPFGGVQLICLGDMLQLAPISKKGEEKAEFAFKSRAWKEADFVTLYLNEVKRTDNKEFADLLLRVRTVDYTIEDFKLLKSLENNVLKNPPVIIYATNRKADEENARQLELNKNPLETFKGKYRGPKEKFKEIRDGLLCPHELQLKVGCRVMITANERKYENDDKPLEYVNGSLGTYEGSVVLYTKRDFMQFDRDEETGEVLKRFDGTPIMKFEPIAYDVIYVKLDNGSEIQLRRMTWNNGVEVFNKDTGKHEFEVEYKQFPLRLAAAITSHKAQGLSLDSVEIDCEGFFADSQFYVAVSRARSLEGLKIKNLKGKHIKANTDALEFYKQLRENNHETK